MPKYKIYIFQLSIDRLIATRRVSDKRIGEIRRNVSHLIISIVWLLPIAQLFLLVAFNDRTLTSSMCFCLVSLLFPSKFSMVPSFWDLSVQLLAVMISFFTYRKNVIMLQKFDIPSKMALNVLEHRFRMWNIIKTTRWLCLDACLGGIVVVLSFLLRNLAVLTIVHQPVDSILVTNAMYLLLSLKSNIYPFLCAR